MELFDRRYQDTHNGPLSKGLRERLRRFNDDGATFREIGDALGFSGAFVSKLLNPKSPANISSKHVLKIVKTVEQHERLAGYTKNVPAERMPHEQKLEDIPLDDLIRAISAKGFRVSVSPKDE